MSFPQKRKSDERFPIKTFGNGDMPPFTDRLQFRYGYKKHVNADMGSGLIQIQAFMEAIVFNVKRLLVINAPPLFAGA